jgi:hypothetical protein
MYLGTLLELEKEQEPVASAHKTRKLQERGSEKTASSFFTLKTATVLVTWYKDELVRKSYTREIMVEAFTNFASKQRN